jgi:hypothetical protein
MEVETQDTEEGTLITVNTARKVAIVVRSDEGERIYLPDVTGNDSGYYVDSARGVESDSENRTVMHPGKVDTVEVIG